MAKPRHRHRPPEQPKTALPFFLQTERSRDIAALIFLYLVTLVLFRAIVFDRMAFSSGGDTAAALSYAQAGTTLTEQEAGDVLWMPYFFSGMPTFGNVAYLPHDVSYAQKVVVTVLDFLYLRGPWTWLVVYCLLGGIFMFWCLRSMQFTTAIALLGALTYMLSPYAVGLAGEGHGSKLMALTYLPLVFLLARRALERRDLLSTGLLAAAVGTLMLTNHMQIVYYVLLLVGFYTAYHLIAGRAEGTSTALRKAGLASIAVVLGLAISSYVYLSVYEYAQYSMRGGGTTGTPGGLTWDYATSWSWHPYELLTLLIPSFFGFQLPYYWGYIQPWTNSTVYVGLIPMLLAGIAFARHRNATTWFFAIASLLVVLVSFGRNFAVLYELLFTILPFFNKFRAPAMILHLLAFTLPVLGAYGLRHVINTQDRKDGPELAGFRRAMLYAAGGCVALLLLTLLLKSGLRDILSGTMFLKEGEMDHLRRQYGQQFQQALNHLLQTRFDLFWTDTVRFALFAAAAFGAIAAYLFGRIRRGTLLIVLTGVLLVDLFIVNDKLIHPAPDLTLRQSFQADATVGYLKEQSGRFRVFPVGDLFMDNTYAYHGISSIGGYSPAKLKIYQTMLDSCLFAGPDPEFPLNMSIVNMLGVRYLIAKGRLPEDRFTLAHTDAARRIMTYENPFALPRAFFVREVIATTSESSMFRVLNDPSFDPARTAVVLGESPSGVGTPDSAAFVRITKYESGTIVLETATAVPALLVLSEVYYPAGWSAYVDGVETSIYRTNAVLRSVVVPAGSHTVEFVFDPPAYRVGWLVTNAAWVTTLVLILLGLWKMPAFRSMFGRISGGSRSPVPDVQ